MSFDFLINFKNYFSLTSSRYPVSWWWDLADLYCIYTLISQMLQVPEGGHCFNSLIDAFIKRFLISFLYLPLNSHSHSVSTKRNAMLLTFCPQTELNRRTAASFVVNNEKFLWLRFVIID